MPIPPRDRGSRVRLDTGGQAVTVPSVMFNVGLRGDTKVKSVFLVLCCSVGIAITLGAQGAITTHTGEGAASVAARLQRIEDVETVRAIPGCYGYGHDLIYKHLGSDQTEAIDALQRCHVNALTTHVFLFDETTAATTLHSIRDLIAFIESFARDQGYSGARNVPGNVQVEFTGPTTARVQSSTVAPHFPHSRFEESCH